MKIKINCLSNLIKMKLYIVIRAKFFNWRLNLKLIATQMATETDI